MSRARPHSSSGPEPVRCTDCGSWRVTGEPCTTCYPAPTLLGEILEAQETEYPVLTAEQVQRMFGGL